MRPIAALLVLASCLDDRQAAEAYADAWCREYCSAEPKPRTCDQCAVISDAGGAGGGSSGGSGGGSGGGSSGGSDGGSPGTYVAQFIPFAPRVGTAACVMAQVTALDGMGNMLTAPFTATFSDHVYDDSTCGAAAGLTPVIGSKPVWLKVLDTLGPTNIFIDAGPPASPSVAQVIADAQAIAVLAENGGCVSISVKAMHPGTTVGPTTFNGSSTIGVDAKYRDGGEPALFINLDCGTGGVGSPPLAFGQTYGMRPTEDEVLLDAPFLRRSSLGFKPLPGNGITGSPCVSGNECRSRQCGGGKCLCAPAGSACTVADAMKCCSSTATPTCMAGFCAP